MMLTSQFQSPAGGCALLIFVAVGIWRLTHWIREGPRRADPWDAEIETSLQSAESVPVCRHCFAEQVQYAHFCRECGTSVGDYNNLLPYEYIFSIGETLRTGASGKYRITLVTTVGYFLWSLSEYMLFAPVYWFFLLKNAKKISTESREAVE